ncbi:MAG: YraN family protein [Elusimicrobia bacterium]|nr:YraN family protein [Elusimicrobiota bacterium]
MNSLGKACEDKAALYLRSRGYKIVERGWSSPMGEIDIIALDGRTLVFVEVRARSSAAYGTPAETVGRAKQARIIKTALAYLKAKGLKSETLRFDVIGFTAGAGPEHIENAFEAGGYTY